MSKINNLVVVGLVFTLVCFMSVVVGAEDLVDPNIPDSWYEAPKLASDMGITEFHEAPMLAERVSEGVLPAVEKRLPENPPVVEPYAEVGNYGGRLNGWAMTLDEWDHSGMGIMMGNGAHYGRAVPDGSKVVPYIMKGWEWSDDGKQLTLHIRKGTKWSDGVPFTADDFMYWWESEANNEDLNPVPPEKWDPSIVNVEKLDKYTVRFTYGKPAVASVSGNIHSYMQYGVETPAHYYKKFHPDFAGMDEVMKAAKAEGFETWIEYYQYMTEDAEFHPERGNRPTLRPYVVVERTPTYIIGERNPYFMFVDTEGNQLPYIDSIKSNLANSLEMQVTKTATGEADLAGRQAKAKDLPLFKKNQEKYGYKTFLYTEASRGILLGFNFTHLDPQIREVFQNVKFRRAMSLAVNRKEINDKLFYGMGDPAQFTHLPSSPMYEEEFARAYADYDPDSANKLLDEVGLKDVNGDGFRELPNGDTFKPAIMYMERYGPATKMFELVKAYWAEVGVDAKLNLVESSLWEPRKVGSNYDIAFYAADNGITPITAASQSDKYFPVGASAYWNPWPLWSSWYSSDGERGEEPPANIKEVMQLKQDFMSVTALDDEWIRLGKKLLQSQADNLWCMGLVGLGPKPVVIDADLRNVPTKGLWNDGVQRTQPLYPIQFFFAKGADELE